MLIDREIKPGVSLGGIKLGESVDLYLDKLSTHYLVRDDREASWAFVGDDLISIAYDADRVITTVCANSRFQGSYAGLIWPGMTVLQVIQNTHAQTEYAGCIVINGIDGWAALAGRT